MTWRRLVHELLWANARVVGWILKRVSLCHACGASGKLEGGTCPSCAGTGRDTPVSTSIAEGTPLVAPNGGINGHAMHAAAAGELLQVEIGRCGRAGGGILGLATNVHVDGQPYSYPSTWNPLLVLEAELVARSENAEFDRRRERQRMDDVDELLRRMEIRQQDPPPQGGPHVA